MKKRTKLAVAVPVTPENKERLPATLKSLISSDTFLKYTETTILGLYHLCNF
jgi:hypothetical protein